MSPNPGDLSGLGAEPAIPHSTVTWTRQHCSATGQPDTPDWQRLQVNSVLNTHLHVLRCQWAGSGLQY